MAAQIKPKEQKILQQAQTLISQNDAQAAKDILLNYARNNKPGQFIIYYLNLSRAILGEINDALTPTSKLVKKYPDNIEYLKLLGGIQHGLHSYDEAIITFRRAIKINNRDFQTLTNLANALKESNQLDEAESLYKQSLNIQPSQPDALTNYGLLLQVNAKLDEAITLHQKALQIDSQHYVAMYNLAFSLNEKTEHETSLQYYYKIIEAIPNHVRALCDIAHVHGQMRQYELALPFLQRAVDIAPNDTQAHLSFGHCHRLMKNSELAEASYNEALRLDINNQVAKYFIATMNGDDTVTSSPDGYVQELFDNYADSFDSHLIEELQYKTPELIGDLVKKHCDVEKKYKILDLGCGTGLAGIHLECLSSYMVGVDLSEKMIKKAALRNIYNELIASGIDQYFESQEYQPHLVISADVFVYIGDIAGVFSNVSNAIIKNGLFVFSTEDTQDAEKFLLRDSGRFAHNENYIESLAKENNFALIDNEKTIIRYDKDLPIHGQIYLLKRI